LAQGTQKAAADGKIVAVTGVLRPFLVADLERDFDFDLSPELQVKYENKPVFITDAIRPFAIQGSIK